MNAPEQATSTPPATAEVVLSRERAEPTPDGSTSRVIWWIAASAVGVLVAVMIGSVYAARTLAEREAVNDAASMADLVAESVVQPALTDGVVDQEPAALRQVDEALSQWLVDSPVVRVKLWRADGTVVWSDEPRLRGEQFPLGADELEVLSAPRTRADVSDLDEPENRFERGQGTLLEVYRPVWTPGGTPLLFEIYPPYDTVEQRSSQLWRGLAGLTVSSLLVFVVLLSPILSGLLRRLRRDQQQREVLLQQALDASAEERRRIAGTLHDGVVQELAATSFTVAGAEARARRAGQDRVADDLGAASDTLRSSIGALRSLLVEIYPRSLEHAGLSGALTDLVGPMRARGLAVQLDLPDPEPELSAEQQRLIFRIAQECLHNVRKHARAEHVRVRLAADDQGVVLEIADDGVGFDVERTLAHPPEGHLGLRVLADLASKHGARLGVRSGSGAGCHWTLQVPR